VRARGLQDREGSGDANGVAVTLLRVAASTPHLKSLKYPEPRFLWLLLLHHWVLLPVAFIPPRGSPARRRIKRLEGRPIASIYSLGGRQGAFSETQFPLLRNSRKPNRSVLCSVVHEYSACIASGSKAKCQE
jgi:hypothetical protein